MSFWDKLTSKQKNDPVSEPPTEDSSITDPEINKLLQEVPRPDPYSISLDDLFPFGVPSYSLIASEDDKSYMYQRTIVCPVCRQSFTLSVLATSRLQVKSIDKDFRKRCKNLEPLWYRVWHCPHCYYTALEEQFEEKPDVLSNVNEVREAMTIFKQVDVLSFSEPRTVNEVITSMYLALLWAQFGDPDYTIRAKLWLYLSWLYDDLNDRELYLKTTERALEYYRRMYYTSRQELEPAVEQGCFLTISELFIRLGNLPAAYDSLVHVTTLKTGKRLYLADAHNRLADVREMMSENGD